MHHAIMTWGGIALIGQWLFSAYIFILYAMPLVLGITKQAELVSPTSGYDASGSVQSAVFFGHIIPAIILAISGLFQLIPQMRKRFVHFHRWNGRIFFTLGLGLRLSNLGAMGITLNGLLIPIAVILAWKYAVSQQFAQHRRFAVHSFLLVNGVWTFRLYLMGWYMLNQGKNGNTSTLDGPVDIFFSFACYLLPMLVAELYFWAVRQTLERVKWLITGLFILGSGITLLGIVAAFIMMWYPRVNKILMLIG